MKNQKALFLLLTANVVSGFAQGISILAIPWYFVSMLGRPSLFGVIYFSVTAFSLFWSLYAGTLVDRYSRKKIFSGICLAGGIILGSVAVAGYVMGQLPMPFIILIFAVTILIFNIHYPALYAFAQEITEKQNYGKINSYIEIQGQSTTMIAGALGALLLQGTDHETFNLLGINVRLPFTIHRWEMHEIFLMDAITYFIAIALITMIRYVPQVDKNIDLDPLFSRLKTGFRYLLNNRLLLIFGNASLSIFVVLLVEVHLLLPMYVNNHLQARADVYASSEVYYSIGALLAGAGIRRLFRNTNTVLSIIFLMFTTVAILWICAFTRSVGIFYVFSFIIGITNAGTRVLRTTYLFNHIPNEVMGRTNGVFVMVNILLRLLFIGIFSIPFFVIGSNVTWAYFIFGCFVLLSSVLLCVKYDALVRKQ